MEIVRRLYDLWGRRDFAGAVAFYVPDIAYERISSDADFAGAWRGVDQMRRAVSEYLSVWEDYRNEPEDFRDLGDRVLVRERHKGRGKRSGAAVDHPVGALFTLRNGRLVRLVHYWNLAEALEAAGLTE